MNTAADWTAHQMTKLEAHAILDQYKAGTHFHRLVVNQALQCTGDLCRNLEPLPKVVKTARMEKLRLVTNSGIRQN